MAMERGCLFPLKAELALPDSDITPGHCGDQLGLT